MSIELSHKTAGRALLVVACLVGATLVALARSGATPAAGVATRTIIFSLSDAGKGRWSIVSASDRGSIAMNYSWRGNVRFKVPVAVLKNPSKRFSVPSETTLFGSWNGDLKGTKSESPYNGPYHCTYRAANVRGNVSAALTNGTTRGTMQIVLTEDGDDGFFVPRGRGATVACSNDFGETGPPHFEPEWLFRDAFSDHGQLTSTTAVITLPTRLLQRGSTTLRFPREVGAVNTQLRGKYSWDNRGTLRVSSRYA